MENLSSIYKLINSTNLKRVVSFIESEGTWLKELNKFNKSMSTELTIEFIIIIAVVNYIDSD
jgi:hypothetical protein